MKKFLKIIGIIVLVLILGVVLLGTYVKVQLPNVGKAPDLTIHSTPDRIERGKYLATNVTLCIGCHSERNWDLFTAPIFPASLGAGGELFGKEAGFPGTIYTPNITPFNLHNWSDGEIYRAITSGVKKDGSAIFPVMPYLEYGKMDTEDIYSIISYIRTLPEKQKAYPATQLDFPLNFIVNTIPAKGDPHKMPSPNSPEYGAYVINAAGCMVCHTNEKDGKQIGMPYAGNREFKMPGGSLFSANITPDVKSGIGSWTKEIFISRFKHAQDSANIHKVNKNDFQTVMPWESYSGMKESDLGAIYDYLRSVKPVNNIVTKYVVKKG